VAAVAAAQWWRIRYDQLRAVGIADVTIRRWRTDHYLHRVLPRVYAVGNPGGPIESHLSAALLYAGPGAMLSHGTAVWWLDLLKYPPPEIHVSTPRRVRSRNNIVVHGERDIPRIDRRGLPVTTPSQAILDFAATGSRDLLRLVLANADYHDCLDVRELQRMTGRGVDGTVALNDALRIHLPQLALTRSDIEILMLTFCETQHVPIPDDINTYLYGFLVDAVWRAQRLVVEVDGWRGHRTPAQLYENHRRDLALRSKRFVVLRYARRQFIETPAAVAEDVLFHLARKL
jgi:predicted transcriptional regulator of viral defense system